MKKEYDYLIIGAGIIGLTLARALKEKDAQASILLIDKEEATAAHASGRNSGVLHAGFYYTANSLKAQFTVQGNQAMRTYCTEHHIPLNTCGKLVVAQNETELEQLYELERRGKANGSNIRLIEEKKARDIDSNVRTFQKVLWSPDTASVDPLEVCRQLQKDLESTGVTFNWNTCYRGHQKNTVLTTQGDFSATKIINAAGLYADHIAHDFGFGQNFTIIPFKGIYLKYTKNTTDVTVNIYPVPNLKNPFLGVHFTKTVEGAIKIGPTAIPAFWRENYEGWGGFNWGELTEVLSYEAKLFLTNAFGFRQLAFEEMRKYNKQYFVSLAQDMVQSIDPEGFTQYTRPGIRAQLLDTKKLQLLQDFTVEGDAHSIHILNAVSPAFTCSFPFAKYVVQKFIV